MQTRRTAEDWRELIELWQQSGLKVAEFCQEHGLTQSNFYLWRKRMAGPDSTDTSSAGESEWHLLTPQPSTPGWEIELALPGGVTLRLRR